MPVAPPVAVQVAVKSAVLVVVDVAAVGSVPVAAAVVVVNLAAVAENALVYDQLQVVKKYSHYPRGNLSLSRMNSRQDRRLRLRRDLAHWIVCRTKRASLLPAPGFPHFGLGI